MGKRRRGPASIPQDIGPKPGKTPDGTGGRPVLVRGLLLGLLPLPISLAAGGFDALGLKVLGFALVIVAVVLASKEFKETRHILLVYGMALISGFAGPMALGAGVPRMAEWGAVRILVRDAPRHPWAFRFAFPQARVDLTRAGSARYVTTKNRNGTHYFAAPIVATDPGADDMVTAFSVCSGTLSECEETSGEVDGWLALAGDLYRHEPAILDATTRHGLRVHPDAVLIELKDDLKHSYSAWQTIGTVATLAGPVLWTLLIIGYEKPAPQPLKRKRRWWR